MKKLKLLAGLSILCISSSLFATTIYVNDKLIPVESQLVYNSNYVPIRFVAETLGAKVEWQKPNVIVKKDNMELILTIDDNTVSVNGQQFSVPYKPYLSNNITYVPLRLISEQLNCDVTADDKKNVYIVSKGEAHSTPVIPEDKRNYALSPNGLWGVVVEKRPMVSDHVTYLKNMKTDLYKEIYVTDTMTGFKYAEWQYDNQLVLTGIRDLNSGKDNPRIMLYNPETGAFKTLVDQIEKCKMDYEKNDLYYIKDGKYYVYHLNNGVLEPAKDIEHAKWLFSPV